MSPRSLGLAWSCVLLLVAAYPADTAAQAPTTADILGTWRGTSICVDKVAFPACHDEEVIYEVGPAAQSPDSVILRADKVVNGARESMGDLVFGRGPGGEWVSVFQTQRSRVRWTVRVEGTRMSGTLIDLPSGRQIRAVSLQRSAQSPMAQLLVEFRAARPPVPAEVLGRWVLVTNINTERFLSGRDGPDHVDSDSTGLRGGHAGNQFYWTMLVSQRPSGQVVAASTTYWMVDEVSPLAFPVGSDMTFTKEYGGDSVYRYRCRLQAERLICVLGNPTPGHGVVFRTSR